MLDFLIGQFTGEDHLVGDAHVHDWLTMKAGVQIKEKLHIPLILTVHSTEYDRAGMLYPNQWFIDLEREGMQKADRIIAVSNYTKKIVVEKYGIPAEKVTVIHNAVYPMAEEGEKKPLVLFLGRLTIQKGPEFFLKAAKKVLEYEDAKFVIAGVGDMMILMFLLSLFTFCRSFGM